MQISWPFNDLYRLTNMFLSSLEVSNMYLADPILLATPVCLSIHYFYSASKVKVIKSQ